MERSVTQLACCRGSIVVLLLAGLVPASFAAPANLHTVSQCRVFDSRQPANGPALTSGVPRTISVAGLCGVPATATSAAVNITVTDPTSPGHLRLYATGPAPGLFSSLNFSAGQTRGNNALVQLSALGQVDALPTMPTPGTVHLIVDVFGYFEDDDAPVAVDDAATVNEDAPATTIDVLTNDTDTDGGPILVSSVTQPAGGTVLITNGGADLTYQPDPDFCNAPAGTIPDGFTYTLSPGGSTANVSVTVTCENDAPVLAGAGTVTFTEDGPPVAVAPALTVQDVDDASLQSATVTISNLLDTGAEIAGRGHDGDGHHGLVHRPHPDPDRPRQPRELRARPPPRHLREHVGQPERHAALRDLRRERRQPGQQPGRGHRPRDPEQRRARADLGRRLAHVHGGRPAGRRSTRSSPRRIPTARTSSPRP